MGFPVAEKYARPHAPELASGKACCPFKLDVWQLGYSFLKFKVWRCIFFTLLFSLLRAAVVFGSFQCPVTLGTAISFQIFVPTFDLLHSQTEMYGQTFLPPIEIDLKSADYIKHFLESTLAYPQPKSNLLRLSHSLLRI